MYYNSLVDCWIEWKCTLLYEPTGKGREKRKDTASMCYMQIAAKVE